MIKTCVFFQLSQIYQKAVFPNFNDFMHLALKCIWVDFNQFTDFNFRKERKVGGETLKNIHLSIAALEEGYALEHVDV